MAIEPEIKSFVEAVGAVAPQPGHPAYVQFKQVFRRSNYFILNRMFMIVKISRTEKPFWGLGKQYVDFLNVTDNYLLVLLTSARDGYFFTKSDIEKHIRNQDWRVGHDNQYKINPPLPDRNSFLSPASFMKKAGLATE